jgi:glutamate N-acetyltransferase/amino-acid N-acetyltransferase
MAKLKRSPLAPKRLPSMPEVAGVRMASVAAGITYRNRADLTLFEVVRGSAIAGVLTKSSMPGAPVDWCRRHLGRGKVRAIVINAGNANVFNGRQGADDVAATANAVAQTVGCKAEDVFVSSTGVIGENLAVERLLKAVPKVQRKLAGKNWGQAARAICTTDTFPKAATKTAEIGGKQVTIAGIAKGSGMIAPNMGTMLSYIFTDARLPAGVLRNLLRRINERTFNAITVDGDTSTSDTVLLVATGKGPRHTKIDDARDAELKDFATALEEVMLDLAQQVVRDGEGASKFIAVTVKGAGSQASARTIAMSIANSPLVKTAIAGEDANWGRIIMAVGKSGEAANRDALSIRVGGVLIAENGYPHPDYREQQVAPHMRGQEIEIEVDVGVGRAKASVWTCDLTHGYISINADYRS